MGKPAYTEITTIAYLSGVVRAASDAGSETCEKLYSLVALKLHTGRTHQIRVHMRAIGHALICDEKYSSSNFFFDSKWCSRNFLHTYHLSFWDVLNCSALVK